MNYGQIGGDNLCHAEERIFINARTDDGRGA